MRSGWAGRAAPFVFVLIWSTGFVGARYGLPYAPPFTLLLIRLSIASAALALLAVLLRSEWPRTPRAYGRSSIVGVLLHTMYLGGLFYSIDHGLPVAVTALIVCLQPACVAMLAGPVLGERLMPRQWAGIALGFAGAVIVLAPGLHASGADAYQPIAVATAVLALASTTAATLLQKRWGGGIPMLPGTAVQYAAASVVLVPLALLLDHRGIDWEPQFIGALTWMVVALSIGAVLLMFWMLRHGTASGFSSLYFLVPPVTLLMGFVLFGQTLPWVALVGFAVSSLGVLLVREAR